MRWYWIDRFIEFQSGHHAVSIKNVSLAEEQLQDHFPGYPTLPDSLVIEGIAQTGGLLVGERNDFKERVVLAKVSKATFHRHAVPGDTLTYRVKLEDINEGGAVVVATSHIGDDLQAEVSMMFAHLSDIAETREMFQPADFLCMLRVFALYDVGRKSDGSPLDVPAHLLEAERVADGVTDD